MPPTLKAPNFGYSLYSAGEGMRVTRPGDFILTHNNGVFQSLIRFGQSLTMWGDKRRFIRWNHAALIVGERGELVEALGRGVSKSHITKYERDEYYVVHVDASLADRKQAVEFAMSCIGKPYGWFTIAGISLGILTGMRFVFGTDGTYICSGLVARALERTGAKFPKEPMHIMPADLARYYDVDPEDESRRWTGCATS